MTNEVVKYEPLSMVKTDPNSALAPLREVLGPGERLTISMLEQAKVPTGGALTWVMDDGETAKAIEGVIVLRQPMRVYWKDSFTDSGGGNPPDCHSLDMVQGIGDPGGSCSSCPLSYVNSYGQDGPRCSDRTRLFVLQDGAFLPILINLPATSFGPAQVHALRLANKGTAYYGAVSRITLERKQSDGGIAYAVAKFEKVRNLDSAEQAWMLGYRDAIMPYLNGLDLVSEEAE